MTHKLFENPEYFNIPGNLQEIKLFASKKTGKQQAVNNLDSTISGYFKNIMHWKNDTYKINLTFQPNTFATLRELIIALDQWLPQNLLPKNWQNNDQY